MNVKWLAILACLLFVACDSNKTESSDSQNDTTPSAEDASAASDSVDSDNPAAIAIAKFQQEMSEWLPKFRNAEPADREELRKTRPIVQKLGEQLRQLAEENPDDAAIDAYVTGWLAVHGPRQGQTESIATMFEKHFDSPAMKNVAAYAGYFPSAETAGHLQKLIETTEHREVKAGAYYGFAVLCDRIKEMKPHIASNPRFSKADVEFFQDFKVDNEKLEEIYTRIKEDFGDVTVNRAYDLINVGEFAEKNLFSLQHLEVGCIAPDIQGPDMDGVEFKLSDYRGKVVMLDFWGDW